MMKLSPFGAAVAAAALITTSAIARADVSANIGVVSDYLFRGVDQSNGAAMQGGLDYSNESGFYAGTWLSNVDFGGKEDSEVDLYAGFGGDVGDTGLGYDLGALYYWYPGAGGDAQGGDLDYAEVYLNASFAMVTAGVAYTVWGETDNAPFDTGDLYYSASADIGLPEGFTATPFIGYYDFDSKTPTNDTADYKHYGLSLAKDVGDFGSVSVNFEKNDIEDDEGLQVWFGWSKEL